MFCSDCNTESLILEARFCRKCGAALPTNGAPKGDNRAARWLALPFILIGRAIAYLSSFGRSGDAGSPRRAARIRQSTLGLSGNAKRVYRYLAGVTLRFG